jgi:hypothetical protein
MADSDERRPAARSWAPGAPKWLCATRALTEFRNILDQETIARLTEFARELEARATALEPPAQTFSHGAAVAVRQAEGDA